MKNFATSLLFLTLGVRGPRIRAAQAHHHPGCHRPDPHRGRALRARRAGRRRRGRGGHRAARSREQRPVQGHGAHRHADDTDDRGEVDVAGWKQQRNDYVVVGRLTALANGDIAVDAELVNVLTGSALLRAEV